MERLLKNIFLASWLVAHPASGADATQLPGATVEELLDLARQQNPELAAMRLEADRKSTL